MTRGLYLAFTNPTSEDRLEDFNRFYDDVHVEEVAATTGFVSARRLQLSLVPNPVGPIGEYAYLTIYEVESDDLEATFSELAERRPSRTRTDTIKPGSSLAFYVEYERGLQTPAEATWSHLVKGPAWFPGSPAASGRRLRQE